ncbi:3-phosphoserine/phosphohydroxythreonine transaminase [Halalkalibacter sp. APA_J-10(15)]|uniref:3-phosphoserine/phosphohydroxythreonine transaminase n=1 Tax=Halalkalibacter sp. APA_J-10(15) TaxID=2933805 RepID=UPI001FF1ECD4|nr:3-phosphoserine/phosphohydroxythreonine transaminase [Halalkalibacter sp. APA_J-10(15)]MCK0471163.1 3-phosphoserine/phosphohydroxythreonine transaminase [Halalkalibacter sp. APA_J-10(15)]
MEAVYNFNAGPSALPKEVLERAQQELTNFSNTGMSVMELSHRSKEYEAVHQEAIDHLKELLNIPDNYQILLLQGGASLQFAMIPLQFLIEGKIGNYIITGSWSEKAIKEAKLIGETFIGGSAKENQFRSIPDIQSLQYNENDAYVHLTSNNTIFGTQWHEFPTITHAPLIADMSSDILSRSLNVDQFGIIYAGAQKNLGPSGVTVAIVREDLLEADVSHVPTMLQYKTHSNANSLYNTPPSFSIYVLNQVLRWVKEQGGVEILEKRNVAKAKLIYDAIDESNGFYRGHAEEARSNMNITFNLPSEEHNKAFLAEAKELGFVGLNGHRSVGGCRASTYNAVPVEACEKLRDFMKSFQEKS